MATRNKRTQKPKTSKSSLVSHTFPPFYACYLLKSIKSPKSVTTYIGSTPHPPRRIRQHNGEITQGAWKTSRNRPWVMSMIVHGFPSKLAALQFEWAWQHPNLSRHLRGEDMTKGRSLKANIAVARSMLTTHPYTSWPLHVKLFTSEAVKGWTEACKNATPLPLGFTFSVELEGVDGKRNDAGSGRQGPIDVTDKIFTSEHIAKHNAVLSVGTPQTCTICGSNLDVATADPLSLALCPTAHCTAYAHLKCLASYFLSESSESMIPRGGECVKCHTYVLWGDIVRGCYRRRTGGQGTVIEQSVIVEESEQEEDSGQEYDEELGVVPKVSPKRRKTSAIKKPSTFRKQRKIPLEEEGEFFDLDAVSSSDASPSSPSTKKTKPSSPRPRGRPPGSKNKPKASERALSALYDIDDFSLTESESGGVPGPSRRQGSRSRRGSDKLADALASLHMQGADTERPSIPQQQRGRERPAKRGTDDIDVIEISD